MNTITRSILTKVLHFLIVIVIIGMPMETTSARTAYTTATFDCANVTEIPQSECEALVAMYESTSGTYWTNKTGWLTTNTPCSWHGVTCFEGKVIQLDLWQNNLQGPIPSEIGDFTALYGLSLGSNQLSGIIPSEIGNLTALTHLILGSNQLSGMIPSEIGNLTMLQSLLLGGNQLSGPIQPEIANLTKLTSLALFSNQLTGAIPAWIGTLTTLRMLNLSNNQLSGTIPPQIGNLTSLGVGGGLGGLDLSNNQLSGPIPPEIGNLTALNAWFSLSDNQLSGPIPPEIGNLIALRKLYLQNNQLSGAIPPEIGRLTALEDLRLWNNQLSGPIPSEIGNFTKLKELRLDNNQLSGAIPTRIGNLSALTSLSLRNNLLSGAIPAEIGNLVALTYLDLSNNKLTNLPANIGNLSALTSLILASNQFANLPVELWNLPKLNWLFLADNQLTNLSAEIANLNTTLRYLDLYKNSFDGEIPTFMTSLTQLERFSFYDTNWCISPGDILTWISGIPDLYGPGLICGQGPNSLSGTVTLTNFNPATDILVNLYRSLQWNQWRYIDTIQTTASGAYQFTDLGQGPGIDYRIQFMDPTHSLAPQYYNAKPTIATADVITITPGVPRTGIDAVLALAQPPAAEIDTDTGSVAYNPDGTAQITMPAPDPSGITVTRLVACTIGTPDVVTLTLSTGPQYAMANVSNNLYRATIPAADLTGNATLAVVAACSDGTSTTTVGYVTLYDPSGYVTDARTGEPVANTVVTLYNVPGWLPKTGPDDDRPNTCESNLSKAPEAPWSQPAPTHLGIIANADVTPTEPKLPYQHTTTDGYYGWDVSEGCWYVTVEAEDYWSLTSPVVGVPPEVTDLDLALMPTSCPTPLTDVGIVGPLEVTSTLYINTLYTFQAGIIPTDASLPIFYTWSPAPQTGQGTDTAVYRWSAPDTYTVTLKAENCGGAVTITREFVIEAKDMFMVYLPLVLRGN